MKRRIFIAISLPKDIREKLSSYRDKWPELPTRWTKKDNLHITLVFLGHVPDEELLEIITTTKETALENQPFYLTLKEVIYGPEKKIPPRMIWTVGEKSEELGKLQAELESSFLTSPVEGLKKATKAYAPHITLGRIKVFEWRNLEPEERPEVKEDINLRFEVSSIEIMESELKRGGPKYTILDSFQLGKDD